MKQLNCWVADDLAAQVEQAAAQDDRSVSSWLRRLVMAELRPEGASEPEEAAA